MTEHEYNVMKAKFECYVEDYAYLSKRQEQEFKEMSIKIQEYENKRRVL